jgi:hypothetical protein
MEKRKNIAMYLLYFERQARLKQSRKDDIEMPLLYLAT